jgi:branched-chain amino acid transport system ATP-binding protein
MPTSSDAFLALKDVEAVYGPAVLALRGVSFSAGEGEIVALLGANGAGKTTTLKAISNLIRSERGRVNRGTIRWRGEDISERDPASLVSAGLVQVLEGRHVFPQLTVEQNLVTGSYVRHPSRADIARRLEQIYVWFPRLKHRRGARAGLTSGGEQQMIAIGRALMTQPTLVLLDEPSMGLAPIIVHEIFEIIRRLNREEGVSFLLAEQNVNLALRYADYAHVLENGRVVASGAAKELAARDDIKEIYLGGATQGAGTTRH